MVVVNQHLPAHPDMSSKDIPCAVNKVFAPREKTGVGKSARRNDHKIGCLSGDIDVIDKGIQADVNAQLNDLGLEPPDDSRKFGLALAGPGRQNDLTTNTILSLEQRHPVTPLGKYTSCLKA